jgi:hemerythrin-like domain-containing protein
MTSACSVPGADIDEMYMAHTMLRREFTLLPDLIRSVAANDVKRRSLVSMHGELLCRVLHTHHAGEDAVLWPLFLDRATAESKQIVGVMEAQHHKISEAHDAAIERLHDWRKTGQNVELTAAQMAELLRIMTEHMALEEKEVLPLAEKYITAAEWLKMGKHGMDTFPKRHLPLAFGMMMYEGDPEVVRRTLANAPLPIRVLMPIIAPRVFRRHSRRVYGAPTPPRIGR